MGFRAKLQEELRCALRDGRISGDLAQARALIARAGHKTWVVNVKRPLVGPAHVVRYLSRYTHRIAITRMGLRAMLCLSA